MPNLDNTRLELETYLSANWTTTDIAYDNVEYLPVADTSWILTILVFSDSNNVNIGTTKRIRHNGFFSAKIYAPIHKGAGASYQLADAFKTLMENKTIAANLITYAASVRRDSAGEDGYYSLIVSVPFISDDC